MRTVFAIVVSLILSSAWAEVTGPTTLSGTVLKFNAKTVEVFSEGRTFKVPRKFFKKTQKLKRGSRISVTYDSKNLLKTSK